MSQVQLRSARELTCSSGPDKDASGKPPARRDSARTSRAAFCMAPVRASQGSHLAISVNQCPIAT
eukprot:4360986-Amphidinium_carterae.2